MQYWIIFDLWPVNQKKQTFKKDERLSSRKMIENLFASGHTAINAYPIRVVFKSAPIPLPHPVQSMFVVPKRIFRRAHDRNLLRRRMKEAYRLNKNALYEQLGQRQLHVAFIYIAKEKADFIAIEKGLLKGFQKLLWLFFVSVLDVSIKRTGHAWIFRCWCENIQTVT